MIRPYLWPHTFFYPPSHLHAADRLPPVLFDPLSPLAKAALNRHTLLKEATQNGSIVKPRPVRYENVRGYNCPMDRKMYRCPSCHYITDRKNNLKRHIITMHERCTKTLECCDLVFPNKAMLRHHVMTCHRDGYNCKICGRTFCRKALLKRHITVHSGRKDFVCTLCGYATSHKSNLERHKKRHAIDMLEGMEDTNMELSYGYFQENNGSEDSPQFSNLCDSDSLSSRHSLQERFSDDEGEIQISPVPDSTDSSNPPSPDSGRDSSDSVIYDPSPEPQNDAVKPQTNYSHKKYRYKSKNLLFNERISYTYGDIDEKSDDSENRAEADRGKISPNQISNGDHMTQLHIDTNQGIDGNDPSKFYTKSSPRRMCSTPYKCKGCSRVFQNQLLLSEHTKLHERADDSFKRPLTLMAMMKDDN